MAVAVAAPLLRHRLSLRPPLVSLLSWQAPLVVAVTVPRSRARDVAIYALQMWAYYAQYDMPDDDPEALLRRLRVDYPIRADRALGLGEEPTLRLQRGLGRQGEVLAHDYALTFVHWAWFLFPHGALLYLLVRRPERFPRGAALVAACFDLGAVIYWTIPTAPPWWAARNGNMAPVRRIMAEAGQRVLGRLWLPLYQGLEGNPFAAMPSLHFGTSVMASRVLQETGGLPGALAWSYTGALGFALVYLGEHYVVDLIAGVALAEVIYRSADRLEPAVAGAGAWIGRLGGRWAR